MDSNLHGATCLIITMNNGIKIFLDIHPEMDYMKKEEFKLELPNKNGVFKRISFEILYNNVEDLKIPLSMANKITTILYSCKTSYF